MFRVVQSMKDTVFRDATRCISCTNRCFGGVYRLHHQGDKNRLGCMLQLLATANFVPSLPILVTMMMEAIHSSET
jgi:hypothetical protein